MAVKFICDCCGREIQVEDVEDEVIRPPKGWRKIRTVIADYLDDRGHFNDYESEYAHSCENCNVHMTTDEHIEAEVTARFIAMRQPETT